MLKRVRIVYRGWRLVSAVNYYSIWPEHGKCNIETSSLIYTTGNGIIITSMLTKILFIPVLLELFWTEGIVIRIYIRKSLFYSFLLGFLVYGVYREEEAREAPGPEKSRKGPTACSMEFNTGFIGINAGVNQH